jgi:hypothetical protein
MSKSRHMAKIKDRNRRKNRIARLSRRVNRQRTKNK